MTPEERAFRRLAHEELDPESAREAIEAYMQEHEREQMIEAGAMTLPGMEEP